jgi:hypothetical protein
LLAALSALCCSHAVQADSSAAAAAYFGSAHLAVATRWALIPLPARFLLLPELLRSAVCVATLLLCLHLQPSGVTLAVAAGALARGVACGVLVPLALGLCQRASDLPGERLPAALQRSRGPVVASLLALFDRIVDAARHALPLDLRVDASALLTIQLGVCAATAVELLVADVLVLARTHNILFLTALVVSSVDKLRASSTSSVRQLERRLGATRGHATRAELAARLRAAVSEQDVLRIASEALHALFPAATAQAVAAFAADGRVAILDVAALEEGERQALYSATPRHAAANTSVACVCGGTAVIADSNDWPEGINAFGDWTAIVAEGCTAAQLVTACFVSDTTVVGFCLLNFRVLGGFAAGRQAEKVLRVRRAHLRLAFALRVIALACLLRRTVPSCAASASWWVTQSWRAA